MKNRETRKGTIQESMEYSRLFANIQKHITLELSDKNLLTSLFSVRKIQKKELLLSQGQACKNLFLIEQGSLRAFNLTEEGKEATVMFGVQDWWITDMQGFINQQPALVSLEALEESMVLQLDFEAFEDLLRLLPKFERFFRILFQKAYVREQRRVLDTISLSTEERYKRFLLKYPQMVERVTQKQIASYLGITPEFLSSVKKKETIS